MNVRIFFALAATAVLSSSVSAGFRSDGDPHARGPRHEAARERWEKMSTEERQAARERFQRFRALPREEREELVARARSLRESRTRLVEDLAPELRERLDRMEPAKRAEVLRDLARGNAHDLAHRIREALPQEWLTELEKATPEERARYLVEFKERQRGRMASFTIRELGERLGLARAEIEGMQSLPLDERIAASHELRKRLLGRDVEKLGLPKGFTLEEWEAWQTLPPEEFFRKIVQRSRELRERAQPKPDVPPGMPTVDRDGREREEALWRIEEATRTRPEEVIDLAGLTPEERRDQLFLAARARAVSALRTEGVLSKERIDEIASMPPAMFYGTMRRLLGPLHRASCVKEREERSQGNARREARERR